MRTADIHIKGIGVHLPERVPVERAVADGRYSELDAELHELGGAAVAGDLPAPEMALLAAVEAVQRSGEPPEQIDLLLYADSWHQGPDGWLPQHHLQRRLLGGKALAVEVRHGCNGMFSALELAVSYLRFPGKRTALLAASDNFGTPMFDRWRMGPGFIAGDAASALVLSREPGFARLLSVCSGTVSAAEEVHRSGEPLFPPGPTTGRPLDFAARTADFNRRATLSGAGTAIWITVHQRMLAVVGRALKEAGIALSDVTRAAFMNYSRQIVEQRGMLAIGLPMARSTWDFGRLVGHLGASDQIVSLNHLLSSGELGPGDRMLLVGVGPGITVSAATIEITAVPAWAA